MNEVLFGCSFLLFSLISLYLTRIFGIDGVLESLLSIILFFVSAVVVCLLITGYLLQRLTVPAVLVCQIVLAICVVLFVEKRRLNPVPTRGIRLVATSFADIMHDSWGFVFLILSLAEVLWIVFLAYLFPIFDMDGLVYHMVSAAGWIQDGRIHELPFHIWSNVYPHNTELFSTWMLLFLKNDTFIDAAQLVFCFGGVLATAGIARRLGCSKANAAAAGMLFFLTPIVLVQCRTTYIDVAFASMFLISFYYLLLFEAEGKTKYLSLSALAAGFTMGMKYSALPYTGIVLLILVLLLVRGMLTGKLTASDVLKRMVLVCLPLLALGSVWYLRNQVLYGNPFHPFTITLAGHEIVHGIGTPQEVLYNNANTPEQIRNLPMWQQIWTSWTSEPEVTVYDQRLGGLGLQWIALEFPAIVILTVYATFKMKKYLWLLIIPFVVIFLVQPQNWWSRYTIFIAALGAIALMFLTERITPVPIRQVIRVVMLITLLVSIYFSATHAMFPPERILQVLRMPPAERTLGEVFDPRYRWIDQLEGGTTIAFTNDMPYVYTLFGSKLQNTVVMVEENQRASFLRKISESKARFFFTHQGSLQDQWSKALPGIFRLRDSTSTGRVYEISGQPDSSSVRVK
ncbi:MAG TPA: hypothetical protein VLY03_05320 [Bacteroidota bacterium]|nr:hypothetical protein [Bacteroidota bacterium]